MPATIVELRANKLFEYVKSIAPRKTTTRDILADFGWTPSALKKAKAYMRAHYVVAGSGWVWNADRRRQEWGVTRPGLEAAPNLLDGIKVSLKGCRAQATTIAHELAVDLSEYPWMVDQAENIMAYSLNLARESKSLMNLIKEEMEAQHAPPPTGKVKAPVRRRARKSS